MPPPKDIAEMTDIAFSLVGEHLPAQYAPAMWDEVTRILPWLADEPQAGMLPLRAARVGDGLLLARRARLLMRVPSTRATDALALSNQVLNVGGDTLKVGEAKLRPLQAYSTLHAHVVASDEEEAAFLAGVEAALDELAINCKYICGKRTALGGEPGITGYSLVLHELKPEASLRIQNSGLGAQRHLGCGIFIPYKVIGNLD